MKGRYHWNFTCWWKGKYRGDIGYGYGREKSIFILFIQMRLRKYVWKGADFYVWTSYKCYVLDKYVKQNSSQHYVLILGGK